MPLKPVVTVTRKAAQFLGPVAGAIQGELSKQETARALAKAMVVGLATRASLAATIREPEVMGDVIVPLAAAAFTGILDALSRLQQGAPKPVPAEIDNPPPVPLPRPSSPQRP